MPIFTRRTGCDGDGAEARGEFAAVLERGAAYASERMKGSESGPDTTRREGVPAA